jgi:type I restriction enzyme M protein
MTTTIKTPGEFDQEIYNICLIMRRSNASSALQYVPELTWMLFLRILDERENLEAEEAQIVGSPFAPSIAKPYRWQDWASKTGEIRKQLQLGLEGDVLNFVNDDLLPYLHNFKNDHSATPKQKIISEIMSVVHRVRLDNERDFLAVIDLIDGISHSIVDPTHMFAISQTYEGLLLRMGERNNDGGQFFTPREVIRAVVKAIDPKINESVYDPGCGTGGFLAQSYEYMTGALGQNATGDELSLLKTSTFYGREKENLIYPIALANMVLHGIDQPNIWHGNTLTRNEASGDLFRDAPELFDVIMTNPPFGGKEGADAQDRYDYKTNATTGLFLQEVIDSLKNGGRAGMVIDEGSLFRADRGLVQTRHKLIEECNLWCVVSLPAGAFLQAGTGVKTNLIFFTKGSPTEKIWYYDLSDIEIKKNQLLTFSDFDEFFELLPIFGDSENSWTVTNQEIESNNYDLKAVNPHVKAVDIDPRSTDELIDIIEEKGRDIQDLLAGLRKL